MSARQSRSRSQRRRSSHGGVFAAGGGLVTTAVLLSGSAAQAATTTVTVNTLSDPATPSTTKQPHESLADAIAYIDASSGGGEITFKSGLSGTIHLTHALPTLTKYADVYGPGASKLTIDGGGSAVDHSIFTVGGGVSATSDFSGLTLKNGKTGGSGGAIDALSPVDVYGSRLVNNSALAGGAIYGTNGFVQISDTTIADNKANYGAAIKAAAGSDTGASVEIRNSTIDDNTASIGYGAVDAFDDLYLEESTLSGNTSEKTGGAVYAEQQATIISSTIVGNTSKTTGGGGLFARSSTDSLDILNTIIADNSSDGHGDPDIDAATSSSSVEYSLIGDGAGTGHALSFEDSITGTLAHPAKPKLGKLADNGGPTMTMAPLPGSPVINKGYSFSAVYDQRGYGRPVNLPGYRDATHGDGSDIGAVEVQAGGESAVSNRGDLQLSLTMPLSSCVASFDDAPVSFRAARQKHSHATKTKFDSVAFYMDTGTQAITKPVATSTHSSVHPTIPLESFAGGEHTLKAVVTVSRQAGRKHKRHTVKSKVTVKLPVNICHQIFVV